MSSVSQTVHKIKTLVEDELRAVEFVWVPTIVVAWAAVALTIPHYHSGAWYWETIERFAGVETRRYVRGIWIDPTFWLQFVGGIVCLMLLRQPLRAHGLGLGNVKLGLRVCAVFYVLYLPLMFVFFRSQGFQDYYGPVASRYSSWGEFLAWRGPASFFFMVNTEFFYRGFILFSFKRRYGAYAGILASMIPFVMFHFNKPEIETFGSFPVGLALAYLAVRTNSIWYGVLLHASIALFMEALVIFVSGFSS